MSHFFIKKGKSLNIAGQASKKIIDLPDPSQVSIYPLEFKGINPLLLVKEGDSVQKGQAIIEDKQDSGILVVAPLGGRVRAVHRGERRKLINVVIDVDPSVTPIQHKTPEKEERKSLISFLKESGFWPCLRQRPFSKILNPESIPSAFFVKAFHTEPLALDLDVIAEKYPHFLQKGLDILKKLTKGKVYLCCSAETKSKSLLHAKSVQHHFFKGPHPTGNVSTFIQHIHPMTKGELFAYIDLQDVIRLGELMETGIFPSTKVFAITGTGVSEDKRIYARTTMGASMSHLTQNSKIQENSCFLSGNILTGSRVGADGFVHYYHSQIHIFPDKSERKLLRFFRPGLSEFTISRFYLGGLLQRNKPIVSDTSINGSDRAIVLNDIYDRYVTLDIYTYFLIKAILAKQWDEAEALGLLECDPEDFALASFACPSKIDVMGIIDSGLDFFEREN